MLQGLHSYSALYMTRQNFAFILLRNASVAAWCPAIRCASAWTVEGKKSVILISGAELLVFAPDALASGKSRNEFSIAPQVFSASLLRLMGTAHMSTKKPVSLPSTV